MLIIICIIAIQVLMMNIKTMQKNRYMGIRIITTMLFLLSMMRYVTLVLFAKMPSIELISKMEGFYYITIIGISIPLLLVIWYITPIYRQKIKPVVMGLFCMPHMILYISILVLKPFNPVKAQNEGYILQMIESWPVYLAAVQIIFILLYIIFVLYAFKVTTHKQVRGQCLVLMMCQILFLVDGLTYFGIGMPSIPVFTLTEVFGFLAIYYGFSKPPVETS